MGSTQRDYHKEFENIIQHLNIQQRKAVEHIEGPLLVVAGPGTGKTHILSARIGHILLETDTQAQNILCLTFTDAGVHAMRKRLLEFIGPEAHRVHIYTFHSFCNSIIQDNLEYFGRNDLEPLSDLERIDIIRRLLEQLDVHHYLRRGRSDQYFYEKHLFNLFQRMKMEDWTAEFLHKKIDQYLEELPKKNGFFYRVNRGKNKKGDPKSAQIEEETLRMDRLRAGVDLFDKYQAALRKAGRYDYEDMILWVLRAFQKNPLLLRSYQEQYLYFLIDEYQDTNGAQNEVIRQLISYWESPNLFIVGDDDQSIYEFQGARLKNLLDIYAQYERDIELVILEENYRSSQIILDASAHLIEKNEKRIVKKLGQQHINKSLKAANAAFAKLDNPPQVTTYPNKWQEEVAILQKLKQAIKEGIEFEEIAVIYAKHRQAENLIRLLEKEGIPYITKKKVNVLNLPLIQQVRRLLIYIHAEQQLPYSGEYLVYQLLHFHVLGVNVRDIAKMSFYLAGTDFAKRPKWRDLINDGERLNEIGVAAIDPILQFGELLDELVLDAANLSLPHLIEKLINRTGILKYITGADDRIWQTEVVSTFLKFVVNETNRHPRIKLNYLLDLLDRMDDNRISIEIQKTISPEKGIHLLTAHSAKGLEFKWVFILDAIKNHWEPRSRNSSFQFKFPDTVTLSGEEDALEARRRLFYVALTRAKAKVFISYSEHDEKGKEQPRAQFVDELLEIEGVEWKKEEVESDLLLEAQMLSLQETDRVFIRKEAGDKVQELIEGLVLSVSSMNKFLKCPLSFYYENVLRVPGFNSEAASYGTAMHNALQRLFERMRAHKDRRFPAKSTFVKMFDHEMEKLRGYFSAKEYRRRLAMGRTNLAIYYDINIRTWHRNVKVEMSVRNVEVDGVPIYGIIDKLELHEGQEVRIVDYKTGSANDKKVKGPTKSEPLGGNYWRQLHFYKLLYEAKDASGAKVTKGTISYLEPDAKGNFKNASIELTRKDSNFVKKLITDTYQKIQQHEFYEGCGELYCSWCNFVKENQTRDSFVDREIELLDDKKK